MNSSAISRSQLTFPEERLNEFIFASSLEFGAVMFRLPCLVHTGGIGRWKAQTAPGQIVFDLAIDIARILQQVEERAVFAGRR
jgi:hypothetical protein